MSGTERSATDPNRSEPAGGNGDPSARNRLRTRWLKKLQKLAAWLLTGLRKSSPLLTAVPLVLALDSLARLAIVLGVPETPEGPERWLWAGTLAKLLLADLLFLTARFPLGAESGRTSGWGYCLYLLTLRAYSFLHLKPSPEAWMSMLPVVFLVPFVFGRLEDERERYREREAERRLMRNERTLMRKLAGIDEKTAAKTAGWDRDRVEALGGQLRAKIAGKFQTSTFLAGFAAAILGIQITLLWQKDPRPGLLPAAIGLMSAAIALYVTAVVRLDALTLPKRFWPAEARTQPDTRHEWTRLQDEMNAKAAWLTNEDLWEMHNRMVFFWSHLTLTASWLAALSFLCLLLSPLIELQTVAEPRVIAAQWVLSAMILSLFHLLILKWAVEIPYFDTKLLKGLQD